MMQNNEIYDAIIIGAGLTGLTVAFYLKKAGLNIKVMEKESRAGGVINTIEKDGFIYETGPNSGVLSSPELVELFDDLKDEIKPEIANKNSKDRWIWKDGKWESLPSGLSGGIKTPLFTLKDKLNILFEPLRQKGENPDESVEELVKRRLGQSFFEYAVDPFISGIYAGNPEKLITKYALPKLYNLEQNYGSFIKGAIKKRKEPKSDLDKRATKDVFSVEKGLKNLINALEKKIGKDNFIFEAKDVKADLDSKPYSVNYNNKTLKTKAIISTVGGYAFADIFGKTGLTENISNLNYAKVVQVILGFKDWKGIDLKAFGGLVPNKENREVLGVLFLSSIFKYRAPEGGALLSVFMGGSRKPEVYDYDDEKIISLVNREVSDMMKLNDFKPDMIDIIRYKNAIPQYEISSKERYEAIEELEKKYKGLYAAGNIRDGIGMSDRVAQGRKTAESVINYLKNNE